MYFQRHRLFVFLALASLVLVPPSPSHANDFIIQAAAGFCTSTGDVDDLIIGKGAVFSGRIFAGLSEYFYLGGGVHFSVHGGRPVPGFDSIDFTDGGFRFSFDGGGLFYLLDSNSQARPYVAGFGGWGVLGWSYSSLVADEFQIDSDGVGFFYIAPEAGLTIELSESLGLTLGGRALFSFYADETSENLEWDLDGGHFIELFAGLGFKL